ncbi:hypothetical protein CCR95_08220 [Thiocystis minor]|uniref:TIGR04211 family SH3 domain-containing protein n=1 Tax=Thiocystis minor TaxID=61597 RepID=UPI001912E4CB|nr:TIGR04211 family SH3 domain-containing protein [Thiocystis minor]MBK5964069.1 hypothetical protein [Thiocystis minor]
MGRFPLFMLILVGALGAAPARAETQYVTDQLQITMRAGESTRYKIIRMLESGTPLDVLSVNQTTEYARVRTEDGKLGYVLISQLQKEPSARAQIADLQTQLAELKQAPDVLAAKLSKLQSEHAILIEDAQALKQTKQELEQELATIRHASANVLEITNERDRLRIQASELTREREELMQEQTEARNQTKQQWFMLGAAVLFGGVLLGLLLPHLKFRRRKSSWGSF